MVGRSEESAELEHQNINTGVVSNSGNARVTSPCYLHPLDNLGTSLVSKVLTRENYAT